MKNRTIKDRNGPTKEEHGSIVFKLLTASLISGLLVALLCAPMVAFACPLTTPTQGGSTKVTCGERQTLFTGIPGGRHVVFTVTSQCSGDVVVNLYDREGKTWEWTMNPEYEESKKFSFNLYEGETITLECPPGGADACVVETLADCPKDLLKEALLKVGCQDEPKTLNIWKAGGEVWSSHAVRWFYTTLYYRKPVTLEPLPDVCTLNYADLVAASPDGLTYRFPLRTDVKWDDGTPLTAYDFEFAYTVIVELQMPFFLPTYEDVEYVRAVDDYTIEIKLSKCTPQFEESIIYHFAVPKHQFSPMLEEALKTENPLRSFMDMPVDNPISAGPFSFVQWEKGAFVKLVTNEEYYGKGRIIEVQGVGVFEEGPHYGGLLLKLYGTTDTALLGIQKGEIDYIWWPVDPGYIAQLLGNPDITIKKADTLGFAYLAPNCAKEPFDDLALRQALTYLVDKEFIVSRVLQGYGGAAHSVVMSAAGEWYCDEVNKFGSGLSKDERIAKATEILTAAGYTVPEEKYPDGVLLLPDGTPMQPFEILTPPADYDPMRAMSGVLIQEWWREIGVPVTAKSASFGAIVQKVFESMAFDWYILGWKLVGSGYCDHMRYFFHSDQAVPNGGNPMGYENSEVDRYLEDLTTLCSRADLLDVAWKAQEIIIEEVGYCPLYHVTLNEAHRNDTFECWFTQLGGIAGVESPRYCLLYLVPVCLEKIEPKETPEPTKEPERGYCLGTNLLVGMLVAAAAYRRRD